LQQATSVEFGNGTKAPWGEPGETANAFISTGKARVASAGTTSKLKIGKKS
jgi:hypothetical protein